MSLPSEGQQYAERHDRERNQEAAGDANSVNYEELTYEGYGPNGVAIIVTALTDNKNRTAANVRSAFTKGGGNIGAQGSVSFMFDKKGQIIIDKEECDMDADHSDDGGSRRRSGGLRRGGGQLRDRDGSG